jgi:hypothetical protein
MRERPTTTSSPERVRRAGVLHYRQLRAPDPAAVDHRPRGGLVAFEPREIGVGLVLSTSSGIDQLLAPGVIGDDVTAMTVAGFPAVVAKPELLDTCAVDVDVADGQFIDVQIRDTAKAPPIPQDELCRDALRVAEAAVTTLQET